MPPVHHPGLSGGENLIRKRTLSCLAFGQMESGRNAPVDVEPEMPLGFLGFFSGNQPSAWKEPCQSASRRLRQVRRGPESQPEALRGPASRVH